MDPRDQHAAMVGQVCAARRAKIPMAQAIPATDTGEQIVRSRNGLLTHRGYQFGDAKPVYALEFVSPSPDRRAMARINWASSAGRRE